METMVERKIRLQNARRAELLAAQAATHAAGFDCALYDCEECKPKREAMHQGGAEFITHLVAQHRGLIE